MSDCGRYTGQACQTAAGVLYRLVKHVRLRQVYWSSMSDCGRCTVSAGQACQTAAGILVKHVRLRQVYCIGWSSMSDCGRYTVSAGQACQTAAGILVKHVRPRQVYCIGWSSMSDCAAFCMCGSHPPTRTAETDQCADTRSISPVWLKTTVRTRFQTDACQHNRMAETVHNVSVSTCPFQIYRVIFQTDELNPAANAARRLDSSKRKAEGHKKGW